MASNKEPHIDAHTTVIVEWRGPYSYREIADNPSWGRGLYFATGRIRYGRVATIHYCGFTEGSYVTRLRNHHKVHEINREQEFWLGEVVCPSDASRYFLERAESMFIWFWLPRLNDKKTKHPPTPTTLINWWVRKNGEPRLRRHPMYRDLPDVVSWDGEYWRTGNVNVWRG